MPNLSARLLQFDIHGGIISIIPFPMVPFSNDNCAQVCPEELTAAINTFMKSVIPRINEKSPNLGSKGNRIIATRFDIPISNPALGPNDDLRNQRKGDQNGLRSAK